METQQTTAARPDPVVATLNDQVDRLETLVKTVQSNDERKLAQAKQNLAPIVETAKQLGPQYEALLERFGPALERLQKLNLEILRSVRGYNNLGNVVADAKALHLDLQEAIRRLAAIPDRVEHLTVQQLLEDVGHRLAEEVSLHAGGPRRMEEKVRALLKRMEAFERAQRA